MNPLNYTLLLIFMALAVQPSWANDNTYRWEGSHFAFCFISDDGSVTNLDWAEEGRQKDFRFTIAINAGKVSWRFLTPDSVASLHAQGFEIANHSHTHGFAGLPEDCPKPPRGSLQGYWDCDVESSEAMVHFQSEIERDSIFVFAGIPVDDIRTLAYPRHMHSKPIIERLVDEGYIGARQAENSSYYNYSSGDFEIPARNSWAGGISLFRVPLAHYGAVFFGNHSADPPVHHTYEEFVAATLPYIQDARENGGIFALYAHHLGDDDDSYGDINYGSGGMTAEELGWMVDLVRAHGGKVMTFGDAVAYYRSRTTMSDIGDDLVWAPPTSDVPSPGSLDVTLHGAFPNPFNPRTMIRFSLERAMEVEISIYDSVGHQVRLLHAGPLSSGIHRIPWNGRDHQGRMAASGVYHARLETKETTLSRPMTLLK